MSAKERRSSLEILLLFYYQELEKNFGQTLPFLFGDVSLIIVIAKITAVSIVLTVIFCVYQRTTIAPKPIGQYSLTTIM